MSSINLSKLKSIFCQAFTDSAGKFLLVKPPHEYFPIGLSYVASTLERAGIEYDYLDWGVTPSLDILHKNKYYAVGSGGLVADYFFLEKLLQDIKGIDPNIVTILGGHVARDVTADTLFKHSVVDVLVIGESELTLPELLNAIRSKKEDLSKIRSIAYRLDETTYYRTEKRPRVDLISERTMPSFKFFDYHTWPTTKTIPIITGRGCSGRCTFCSPSHSGFLSRPLVELFEEIDYYVHELKRNHLTFVNEVLFQKEDEIIEFCTAFGNRYPAITFDAVLRMDVDPLVLSHLAEAGCQTINVGVETGSDKVLKAVCKMITIDQIRNFVNVAKNVGIMLNSGFLLNNETETVFEINDTLDFHKELKIISGLGFTIPYPGTTIFKRAVRKRFITDEYQFLKDLDTCYRHDFLTEILFLLNKNGKPILPNLTDIPDNEFVDSLRDGYLKFNAEYSIRNMSYNVEADTLSIVGNCPICGASVSAEQSLDKPFTRGILCKNRCTTMCNSLFLHAHVFLFPEALTHAHKLAARLRSKQRVGIYGNAYTTKFLFDHNIMDISISKIHGILEPYPQLEGKYVYEDRYGNYTPNTRNMSLDSFVSADLDSIVITEMHEPTAVVMHDTLVQLGIKADNIFRMLPNGLIPYIPNKQYWHPVRLMHSRAKVLVWSCTDLFKNYLEQYLIVPTNITAIISGSYTPTGDLSSIVSSSIADIETSTFDTICIFDPARQGEILKQISADSSLSQKNIFIAHNKLPIYMYIFGNSTYSIY